MTGARKIQSGEPRYYRGAADGSVFVEGPDGADRRRVDPRFDLRSHSPSGFAWGYGGSGPAQLALALASDILGDDEKAERLYQHFKFHFVGRLPQGAAWGPVSAEEIRLDLAEIEAEIENSKNVP